MSEKIEGGLPNAATPEPTRVAEPASVDETTKQQADQLPDEPASEVEVLKAEAAALKEQLKAVEAEKAATAQRLKDNQEYISRTRNLEKVKEPEVQKPQKTFEDYLKEVTDQFENDPKEGLKKVVRDLAVDRDLERQENERRIAQAEERAFRKAMSLNPEASKTLKEIEAFDAECPDMVGLSNERKMEFINLRKSGTVQRETQVRGKVDREVAMLGDVGGGQRTVRSERIPPWVNDPAVVKDAVGVFKTKQDLLNWADPEKAKAMYLERMKKA